MRVLGLAVWQRRKKVKNGTPGLVHLFWEGKSTLELNNWGNWRWSPRFDFPLWLLHKVRNNYKTKKKKIVTLGRWQIVKNELRWSPCQKYSIGYIIFFLFHSEDFLLLRRDARQKKGKRTASLKCAWEEVKEGWVGPPPPAPSGSLLIFCQSGLNNCSASCWELQQMIYLNVYFRGLPAESKRLENKEGRGGKGSWKKKLRVINSRCLRN